MSRPNTYTIWSSLLRSGRKKILFIYIYTYTPNAKHSDGLAGENESWTHRGVDFIAGLLLLLTSVVFIPIRVHKKTPCYYIIIINRIAARRLTDYCNTPGSSGYSYNALQPSILFIGVCMETLMLPTRLLLYRVIILSLYSHYIKKYWIFSKVVFLQHVRCMLFYNIVYNYYFVLICK